MKRWMAISLGIGLQIAQVLTPSIGDENTRQAVQALIVAVTAAVVKKTSETNPDGTTAKVAWEKR